MSGLNLERPPRFSIWRRLVALIGIGFIALGWWQTGAATAELTVEVVDDQDVPMEVWLPDQVDAATPGVVVTHGFSGSRQLMRATVVALADAGYAVAVPDLSGHGASTAPLPRGDDAGPALAAEVAGALEVLEDQPQVDGERLGVLGHSMGSGAVMEAAIAEPGRVAATVAVSPTDADVSADRPPALLLLAGEREGRFVANAEDLLDRAGGPVPIGDDAPARALETIPGADHLTILFSATMHREAIDWFDATLGADRDADAPAPADARLGLWWLLHLTGVLLVWRAIVPLLVDREDVRVRPGRPLLGLIAGAASALGVLAIAGAIVDLDGLGGMLVGPALAGWLLVTGAVWLRVGDRPAAPSGRELLWAVLVVGVLIAAVGLLAPRVWSPFWPSLVRVGYLPLFTVGILPFTLAFAASAQGRRGWRGLAWYLVVAAVVLAAASLTATAVPALGFVALVLPLLPLTLGLAMLVWVPLQRPWAAGLATAVLMAWLLAVTLPLA